MSLWRLILAGLRHHRRIHIAVALGVAAATAVLTGALLVGDSVRASLKELTLDRLGRIDEVLLIDQFFGSDVAQQLSQTKVVREHYGDVKPAILLEGSVELPDPDSPTRANQIAILYSDLFAERGITGDEPEGVTLNEPLAKQLGAEVGDEVILRVPIFGSVPAESVLGEKTETVSGVRMKVAKIVPAEGLGRFALRPSQQFPLNAYIHSPDELTEALDRPGQFNALLVTADDDSPDDPPPPEVSEALQQAFDPTMDDLGLSIRVITIGEPDDPANKYVDISSQRMMLPDAVVEAAKEAYDPDEVQPVLTYLANTIEAGAASIPYSTVSGVDSHPEIGPLLDEAGNVIELANDEIVLNRWAADDLNVSVGDEITLTYYEPESTHGDLVEAEPATFRLKAIVPLAEPGEPPTIANDPNLAPEVPGVTDQESIDAWDLPFELVEEIRDEDETYWDDYRTTPKAFLTFSAARDLWSSRFGDTTSVRLPYEFGRTPEAVFDRLDLAPEALGFTFLPIKRQGLLASQGTTPFNVLFLGFSFFIIAAAVMLTALLFRLGVDQRAAELGVLESTGLRTYRILLVLLGEALFVSSVGALVGVAIGVGYAALMLLGLRTWWVAAISTPFLELDVTTTSLAIGFFSGVIVSLLTILFSLRQVRKVSVRQLLAGQATPPADAESKSGRFAISLARGMIIVAVLLCLMAVQLDGEAQAGAFFGSGTLVLAGILTILWVQLSRGGGQRSLGGFGLGRLAFRNGARNPLRSTLTIGLVAAATFLIVAISAFRLEESDQGTGGFELLATSSQPILHDLGTEEGRFDLAVPPKDDSLLALCDIRSFRVHGGDDASCLNLYQAQQPQLLGVPAEFGDDHTFAWSATGHGRKGSPFALLDSELASGNVPMILDQNTAYYSLHLWGGVGETLDIDDGRGGTVTLEIVAMLKNSIFQGSLLVSQENLLKYFPENSGFRFFLVDSPSNEAIAEYYEGPLAELESELAELEAAEDSSEEAAEEKAELREELADVTRLASDREAFNQHLQQRLEAALGDYGFDAESAERRLVGYLAVQNTYLSTFQSLGALGLLLGTFGLATVQLRNVMERRGELALMRASGFRRGKLARLVMLENALLLVGGLATGMLAALIAVLPHLFLGGASIPWFSLAWMLILVLAVGLLAGLLSVRATLRAPLLRSLRGE